MYGPLIVDDPAEPKGLGAEAVIVLSDMGIDANGKLEPADGGGDFGTLFGREGNVHLVNGRVAPTASAAGALQPEAAMETAATARQRPDRSEHLRMTHPHCNARTAGRTSRTCSGINA
jgi:FtsP/CotA-like multicopper oxidase with cupredoxin domain